MTPTKSEIKKGATFSSVGESGGILANGKPIILYRIFFKTEEYIYQRSLKYSLGWQPKYEIVKERLINSMYKHIKYGNSPIRRVSRLIDGFYWASIKNPINQLRFNLYVFINGLRVTKQLYKVDQTRGIDMTIYERNSNKEICGSWTPHVFDYGFMLKRVKKFRKIRKQNPL